MVKDRLSIPRIIEKISSRYGVETIYVILDALSVRMADRITLGKIRKIYLKDAMELLYAVADSSVKKFIALIALRESNMAKIVFLLQKMIHILEQNEDIKGLLFLLCYDRKTVFRAVDEFLMHGIDILTIVPPNLYTVAASGTLVFSAHSDEYRERLGIVICGPALIGLEILDEDVDFDVMERMLVSREGVLDIHYGFGKVAVVCMGTVIEDIVDIANRRNLQKDLAVYGFIQFGRNLKEKLGEIVLRYGNILVLGCSKAIIDDLRILAHEFVEKGKIARIPNFITIGDTHRGFPSEEAMERAILDILGHGKISGDYEVSATNSIRFECSREVREAIDVISSVHRKIKKIAVLPLRIDVEAVHVDDLYDAYILLNSLDDSDSMYILVMHMADAIASGDIFDKVLGVKDKRVVIVLESNDVGEGVRKVMSKMISEFTGPGVKVLSFDDLEALKKRKWRGSRKILIF